MNAITIHIVNSVLVMLTSAETIGSACASPLGDQRTCGAGNSRLAMIRSPMPVIGLPGSPIGNGGTTMDATTSSAITAAISSRMFRRRLDRGLRRHGGSVGPGRRCAGRGWLAGLAGRARVSRHPSSGSGAAAVAALGSVFSP